MWAEIGPRQRDTSQDQKFKDSMITSNRRTLEKQSDVCVTSVCCAWSTSDVNILAALKHTKFSFREPWRIICLVLCSVAAHKDDAINIYEVVRNKIWIKNTDKNQQEMRDIHEMFAALLENEAHNVDGCFNDVNILIFNLLYPSSDSSLKSPA